MTQKDTSNAVQDRIQRLVTSNRIVLFMKGTPVAPMCGFSATADKILELNGATEYAHVNVLEDQDIREGVKAYSSWPTIPQLYVQGEFIGGADIMREMHGNGEMAALLKRAGS